MGLGDKSSCIGLLFSKYMIIVIKKNGSCLRSSGTLLRAAAAPLLRAHVLMHVEHIAYLRVRACVHACYIVRVPSPEPYEAKKMRSKQRNFDADETLSLDSATARWSRAGARMGRELNGDIACAMVRYP